MSRRLKRLLPRRSPLIVPAFAVDAHGLDLMASVKAHDLEGIVAKRKRDPDRPGVRWCAGKPTGKRLPDAERTTSITEVGRVAQP